MSDHKDLLQRLDAFRFLSDGDSMLHCECATSIRELLGMVDPKRITAIIEQWAADNDLETSSMMSCELADLIVAAAAAKVP